MRKMRWVLGAAAALAIVTAAYTQTRDTAGAEARTAQAAAEPANGKCVTREVPLDEGYSVTRTELRRVCAED